MDTDTQISAGTPWMLEELVKAAHYQFDPMSLWHFGAAVVSVGLGVLILHRDRGSRISVLFAGFCALYITVYLMMLLLLAADGVDIETAFSSVAACLNNMGPALGKSAHHYQAMSDFSSWVLSFAMIVGRLEIFTILVLFTPQFWQE